MLLQGLKMVVLPLIIFSIISGIAGLNGQTTGRLGGYAGKIYKSMIRLHIDNLSVVEL